MRIRVEGTRAEIAAVIARLKPVLNIQETSRFYDNRGDTVLGRVYLTIDTPDATAPSPVHAHAERADVDRAWPQIENADHSGETA